MEIGCSYLAVGGADLGLAIAGSVRLRRGNERPLAVRVGALAASDSAARRVPGVSVSILGF